MIVAPFTRERPANKPQSVFVKQSTACTGTSWTSIDARRAWTPFACQVRPSTIRVRSFTTDVDVSAVRYPTAVIGYPDPADVAPRLDDPHSARGHDEMVDRAAGPGDPAGVEHDGVVRELVVQARGQTTPPSSLLPTRASSSGRPTSLARTSIGALGHGLDGPPGILTNPGRRLAVERKLPIVWVWA